ncbi:MAG: VWA domain-containing protein [Actinobacteria bacterium]|nr:VWA domain-containing protein [Actinomycetota bacterium]MCA1721666.1 VWA domain-containing protein [Actinomycetota bacterium]
MSSLRFDAPVRLLLLLLVLGLVAAYVWLQRRRPAYAVRFTELDLLASVAPKSHGWRRHVPAALLMLSLVALTTAFAKPTGEVKVPREQATVVVALDTSASMLATDVSPDRFSAAKESAKAFIGRLPERFNVGLVSFNAAATVVAAPTQDHDAVRSAIDRLQLSGGTAIGEAVLASLEAVRLVAGEKAPPARIVLLSDGGNTVGRSLDVAAQAALQAGVPVSTIAYGTASGTVEVQGQTVPVPVDAPALEAFADATKGQSYSAASGEELNGVYSDIGSQVGYTTQRKEVTAAITGLGLLAALGAAATALLWTSRFP